MTERELQYIRDNTRRFSPAEGVEVIVTPLGVDVIHTSHAPEFHVSVDTSGVILRHTSGDKRAMMVLAKGVNHEEI